MITIQMRRGTAAQWIAKNPTLADGEPGYEKDSGKLKVGNGTSTWSQLPYFTTGSGGSAAGSVVLRSFPFAFDTPNLLTGAPLYTPTVGDVILQAWITVTVAWDGVTPNADVGTFIPPNGNGWRNLNQVPLDRGGVQLSYPSPDAGLYVQGGPVQGLRSPSSDNSQKNIIPVGPSGILEVTAANPIKVLVSQNGRGSSPGIAASHGNLQVPTTVTIGVNDEFTFDGLTYTVAPGTYSTAETLVTAMLAATHSGTPLSSLMTMNPLPDPLAVGTFMGDPQAQGTVVGPSLNGKAFGSGANDFLPTSGWANGDTFDASAGQIAQSAGSTVGQAVLYLETVTPL